MREKKLTRHRVVIILTAAIALLLLSGTMVVASHNFSDVRTSAFYHAAVDWGVDRGLIAGCGGGKFCPNRALTRGQAMTIMNNLANVVSPHTIQSEVFEVVNQDFDSLGPVCVTETFKRAYTTAAFGISRTSVAPDVANLKFVARPVYQRNGGGWVPMPPNKVTASQAAVANEDAENVGFGVIVLDPNATYRFGIDIDRLGHTPGPAVDGNYECALIVQIFNRN